MLTEVRTTDDTTSSGFLARTGAVREQLQALARELDPDVLEADLAAQLVEVFDSIERLGAAGKALAAKRVADSNRWCADGARSAAHWVAERTNVPVGQADATIETARHLDALPETDAAFRAGELSTAQVDEIATAAAEAPGEETRLLRAAAEHGLKGLRDECRRVKAAATNDETGRYEAIRKRRCLRHWTDRDGAFRLDAILTPDAGATVLAALEPHHHKAFDDARRAGRKERYTAYAADALVALAQATGKGTSDSTSGAPTGPRASVHVNVDHAALVRGHTEAGETCEIPGVGPIPVATAKAMLSDAILSVLVTDGVDIKAVAHAGRTIPKHVRTALAGRSRTCEVPGCDASHQLEIDHRIPFAEGGPTCIENLDVLCRWHHYLKTHHSYELTPPPNRTWRQRPPRTCRPPP